MSGGHRTRYEPRDHDGLGAAEPSSTWIWVVYALLFAASIPWYLPAGPLHTWLGLPYWVVTSLCATIGIAVFTLIVVRRFWRGDDR